MHLFKTKGTASGQIQHGLRWSVQDPAPGCCPGSSPVLPLGQAGCSAQFLVRHNPVFCSPGARAGGKMVFVVTGCKSWCPHCVARSWAVCSHACLTEGNGTSVPEEMEIKQFCGSGWCKERLWCALCLGIGLGFLVSHLAVITGLSVPPILGGHKLPAGRAVSCTCCISPHWLMGP